VKKLKARDPKAFEQLIIQYQSSIYNLLYRMLGNRAEAEDLLQEVFILVFKQIDTFKEDASISTWIYKIATNTCINTKKYLSRRKHYNNKSLEDLSEHEQPTHVAAGGFPRPDEMAEGLQMEKLLQEIIVSMDDDYKLVLILRDIQNLSYEEIEQILGIARGTVKSRLHRARMELKSRLDKILR
jgi:RNA polymerase sigma-70 factor (ECF subfamily)